MADVGEAIRSLRKARGMSQTDLAEALKVSRSTIAMWESGKREPDLDSLDALADAFNVNMTMLLGSAEDDETLAMRELMRRSPQARTLMRLIRNASDSNIRQTIAILRGLMEGDRDE